MKRQRIVSISLFMFLIFLSMIMPVQAQTPVRSTYSMFVDVGPGWAKTLGVTEEDTYFEGEVHTGGTENQMGVLYILNNSNYVKWSLGQVMGGTGWWMFYSIGFSNSYVSYDFTIPYDDTWHVIFQTQEDFEILIEGYWDRYGPVITSTTTTSSTTTPTTTNPIPLDSQLKLTAIGASATILFGLVGLIFKAAFVETKKHKATVVIVGVSLLACIAGVIWILL